MTENEKIKEILERRFPSYSKTFNMNSAVIELVESLSLPSVGGSVFEYIDCGKDGVAHSCRYCGSAKKMVKH